jgi:hypothetical protein
VLATIVDKAQTSLVGLARAIEGITRYRRRAVGFGIVGPEPGPPVF